MACREPGDKAYTPLHRASLGGHGDIARVLIKAGADKDARTGISGASALHLASRKVILRCSLRRFSNLARPFFRLLA